ncbi:MAG TPA: M48 family metallopeptidase [Gemmatimonadaceae bacterium]|nr:M48 family metallopeptidase [Gemmatimonadaceae bacterium]
MRSTLAVLAVLAVSGLAAACVSQDQETQLGQQEAQEIEAKLPILHDDAITTYVNALGQRIAAGTSRADLQWKFAVVNTDVVNAFALPGGYIYVNRGVLSRSVDESELASVLGHEIEHVVLRHSVKQIEKQQGAAIGVTLACRLTHVCDNGLGQAAIQVGGAAVFARFGRAAEVQADSGGFQNVMRVGIDPRGMLTFFEKLVAEEGSAGGAVSSWFSDHPGTQDRIVDVKRMIAQVPSSKLDQLRADSPEFKSMKTALAQLPAAPAAPVAPVVDTTRP